MEINSNKKARDREMSGIGENMKESEAIEKLKNMRLYMQIEDKNNDCKFTEDDYKANEMAIQALEKQEKIKDLLDSCTAYPDDMCDCLVEIEKILKE